MLQNYSTVHNHTCVSENNYKSIINHLKRPTLKIINRILHERGGAGLGGGAPPPPLSPLSLLVQLNTSKSVKDMNLKLHDY